MRVIMPAIIDQAGRKFNVDEADAISRRHRGFDGPGQGEIVVERLVWPRGVVIGAVAAQESAEMGLAHDEEMIEALAAD